MQIYLVLGSVPLQIAIRTYDVVCANNIRGLDNSPVILTQLPKSVR